MTVTFRIPTPLRSLTAGKDEVSVEGASVREALENLEVRHRGLKTRVCDDRGELRRFINLYVNEEDVRNLQGLATQLKGGDVISIIPAIAGGRE
jgi:molybdopterin synthase sulfur carrier subunit